jgi:hypothetical protein
MRTLFILWALLPLAGCQREHPSPDPEPAQGRSITLWDKPLNTIQQYLGGTWRCQSVKRRGATAYNLVFYTYWKFASGNRLTQVIDGVIRTDTTLRWTRGTDAFNGTTTYLMSAPDLAGVPLSYVVEGIVHDTLLLHDNTADPYVYAFTRSDEQGKGLTTPLFNKPADVVRSLLQGRWKCENIKGGFVANVINKTPGFYWTFGPANRVRVTHNGAPVTDTTYELVKGPGSYTFSDSSYHLNFYDRTRYEVNGFFNDTLVLNDLGPDASYYFLARQPE